MPLVGFIGAVPTRAPDVGSAPNQVPLNSTLGKMARMDAPPYMPASQSAGNSSNMTPLEVWFNYVSDTSIQIRMKGLDGVERSFNVSLS